MKKIEFVKVGDLSPQQDWSVALANIQAIVHTSGRVHVMRDDEHDPMKVFRIINTESTLNFARQAARAGVKRFIFLSTIKVLGESTTGRLPFTEAGNFNPLDPYAISKMEAEIGLMEIAEDTGMEVVIIRPPLVYGPGVKGNLVSMQRWIAKGVPLPFGAINNQRSLIAIENLVDFICCCLIELGAVNQVFLISDNGYISTTELIQNFARVQGKKPILIPVPVTLMKIAARLLGKRDVAERLFGSLAVDHTKARDILGWAPLVTMEEQLEKMTLM